MQPTEKTDSRLRIEDQLCFALYSASRAITKEYRTLLAPMGITYPQYLALMALWQQDGLMVQQIATQLQVDQATVTPLVKRLEKLGIVDRIRSKDDERRVEVFLTAKGRGLYHDAVQVPGAIGCAIGVDPTQAQDLIAQMNAIKSFIEGRSAPTDIAD
ncbi:MarR family winged helix-turn-helix transcriptional regulator [Aestuariibius sp. HNIBRBA575]|uniref:MarR family winged helix-turn-helix transcriptional regulator n=1 Tax=Aestuariibius sp. HNIBRBA575 TaxID=3233343 RepID=UPI0034A35CFC